MRIKREKVTLSNKQRKGKLSRSGMAERKVKILETDKLISSNKIPHKHKHKNTEENEYFSCDTHLSNKFNHMESKSKIKFKTNS